MFWNRLLLFGRSKKRTLFVRLNGEIVGDITVEERATGFEVQMAALSLPAVKSQIADCTVGGCTIAREPLLDITP